MMKCRLIAIVTLSLLVAGCQSWSKDDTPALLVSPDEKTQAELTLVISRMLNDTPVTLAHDAFTTSSLLIIERRQHRDLEGRPATGRMMDPPERFRLILRAGECVVIHERTGEHVKLARGSCTPAPG